MARSKVLFACIILMLFLFSASISQYSDAASSTDLANANAAINSAFTKALDAEKGGGNVTALVAKLELALSLVQRAEAENATNPAQATADLQNATEIADQVISEAPIVAASGSSARETQFGESIGGAITVLVIAALIYIYGSRIYHLSWLYLYRKQLVRSVEEE